jgi:hypothetical protein
MTIFNQRLSVSDGQPSERATSRTRLPQSGGSYSIHPLVALDGVCLYVIKGGEAVGLYFGVTARAAAAALAADLVTAVSSEGPGV